MAILILTSASGAPGVTTTAVGLALSWPRSVLLADCDPGAHQAVLAGYLAGQTASGKGLLRVAEAHRDGRTLREVVVDQTIPLAVDPHHRRLFLPGFTRAGSASLFSGVWRDLADAFDRLDDAGVDVIVDGGRLGASGLAGPLQDRATLSCLVLRSNLRSIMSARVHLPHLQPQGPLNTPDASTGLILVGAGEPYGKQEISKALGLPVLADLAFDTLSAQHLSDGAARPRKFESSGLTRSLHTAAAALSEHMQHALEKVRT